jgi:hypothetical protein
VPPLSSPLRKAADEILRATSGEVAIPVEAAEKAILGYFRHSRLMLRALLVLGANDLDHAGEGLARTTYELAVTAAWLEKDPTRFERLLADYDTSWGGIQREWEQRHPAERFPYADDQPLVPLEPGAKPITLPTVYQRAKANPDLLEMYNAYKGTSLGIHATLASASWGLDSFRAPKRLRAARFALAGSMVLIMAHQVDRMFSLGWGPRIDTAQQHFMAVAKPDAR